jgi:hypothetical protein
MEPITKIEVLELLSELLDDCYVQVNESNMDLYDESPDSVVDHCLLIKRIETAKKNIINITNSIKLKKEGSMDKDRTEICRIISEMLDNPGECEIYHTTKAYDELEKYIRSVRVEALGWAYADACTTLDRGQDYREIEVPSIIKRALIDLAR